MKNDSVDYQVAELEDIAPAASMSDLIRRLQTSRAREAQASRAISDNEFHVDDRVQIINSVVDRGHSRSLKDRRAAVTRMTPAQVYFRMVNRIETYHHRNNLRKAPPTEYWSAPNLRSDGRRNQRCHAL